MNGDPDGYVLWRFQWKHRDLVIEILNEDMNISTWIFSWRNTTLLKNLNGGDTIFGYNLEII